MQEGSTLPTPGFGTLLGMTRKAWLLSPPVTPHAQSPPSPPLHPAPPPPLTRPPAIDAVRTRGESCGGEVTCVVRRCPKGLGTPVFDKLEAELAKAIMSLPATKVGGGRVGWVYWWKEWGGRPVGSPGQGIRTF